MSVSTPCSIDLYTKTSSLLFYLISMPKPSVVVIGANLRHRVSLPLYISFFYRFRPRSPSLCKFPSLLTDLPSYLQPLPRLSLFFLLSVLSTKDRGLSTSRVDVLICQQNMCIKHCMTRNPSILHVKILHTTI